MAGFRLSGSGGDGGLHHTGMDAWGGLLGLPLAGYDRGPMVGSGERLSYSNYGDTGVWSVLPADPDTTCQELGGALPWVA